MVISYKPKCQAFTTAVYSAREFVQVEKHSPECGVTIEKCSLMSIVINRNSPRKYQHIHYPNTNDLI